MKKPPPDPPSVPTLESLRKARRKLKQKTIGLAQAIGEMKHGATLRLHYGKAGRPIWQLVGGQLVKPEIVESEIAALIIRNPGAVPGNDSLFPGALSQTWRFVDDQ